MGRHVNIDAGDDEAEATEPAEGTEGPDVPHEPARHVASPTHPDAPPEALVERDLVGDSHESE